MNKNTGFTIIELMITLALMGIFMTLAVPSMGSIIKNNRLSTQANEFVTALQLARSEAIKRATAINVTATDASATDNEWGKGWSVATTGGTTLQTFAALPPANTLNSTANRSSYQYLQTGMLAAGNTDTLVLCDDRTGETGRQITITATGRISVADLTCS